MNKVHGETDGIKNSILEALQTLYELRIPQNQLWSEEIIEKISCISSDINREIAVYLDRRGRVTDVSIGDHHTVTLSEVEGKRNAFRLTGTRCIHTHPNGSGQLSSVDINSLKVLRLDAMIAVGISNFCARELYVGIISSDDPEDVNVFGPLLPTTEIFDDLLFQIDQTDRKSRNIPSSNKTRQELAIIVGLQTPDSRELNGRSEAEVSLTELKELAETAGAQIVGQIMQKRIVKKSSTVVGRGKLEELKLMVQALNADLVIFDEELTGTQQRNIEEAVGRRVLCRTALILDIFAQRARSREGILQVELAQMEYRLPRLMGMGLALSRLGGGIGTRGPGETKLETDRRHIRARITHLKKQLEELQKQRGVLRENRRKNNYPVISIVGYTNAGKSTLLNALCESDVLAEDKLFATLDTTVRRLPLNSGKTVLLTDTVGFIRKLPHNLLDAFKSTLEEVVLSDLILIVADASDPQVEDHIRIVDEILTQLNSNTRPSLIVLNKSDLVTEENPVILSQENRDVIEISARFGIGLERLKSIIENLIFGSRVKVSLNIPFTEGAALAWLHTNARVLRESFRESGTTVEVEIEPSQLGRLSEYICQVCPFLPT